MKYCSTRFLNYVVEPNVTYNDLMKPNILSFDFLMAINKLSKIFYSELIIYDIISFIPSWNFKIFCCSSFARTSFHP